MSEIDVDTILEEFENKHMSPK